MRGLLGIEELTREEVQAILDRARHFQVGPGACTRFCSRGHEVVNLFFKELTRTHQLRARGKKG
jgi:aspartate carbamoyltransferase catalytic subunit